MPCFRVDGHIYNVHNSLYLTFFGPSVFIFILVSPLSSCHNDTVSRPPPPCLISALHVFIFISPFISFKFPLSFFIFNAHKNDEKPKNVKIHVIIPITQTKEDKTWGERIRQTRCVCLYSLYSNYFYVYHT